METVIYRVAEDVAVLTLNRPDKMNSVDDAMATELLAALQRVETDGARAMILRAEGRGFCAGRDLSQAEPLTEDAEAILVEQFNPLFEAVAALDLPTFAAVQGPALGVGLGLALACDVVIVADDAKIGSPFANIGCVLDSGGHRHFVQRLGPHRALELIYTGRLMPGTEAADIGLVNRSVAPEELDEVVAELAGQVAAGPTEAFRLSKRLVRRMDAEQLSLSATLRAEAEAQGAATRTSDYAEGIGAFQDRRPAVFTGR
jgi:enoyl-CoA hydratase/carnithine racemase